MNDELFLIDDEPKEEEFLQRCKVLIVDDKESVHAVTIASLKNKLFDDKELFIFHLFSILIYTNIVFIKSVKFITVNKIYLD